MIDPAAIQLALRARLDTLVIATTGATILRSTLTGYARATGSFIDDGFAVGMELRASGFTSNNGYAIVAAVGALTLDTRSGGSVESAKAGRTLTVGLPETQPLAGVDGDPDASRPYVSEELVIGRITMPTLVVGGVVEALFLYVIGWYGLPNVELRAQAEPQRAILALFKPGTTLAVGSDVLRVASSLSPVVTTRRVGAWQCTTMQIPLRLYTMNDG